MDSSSHKSVRSDLDGCMLKAVSAVHCICRYYNLACSNQHAIYESTTVVCLRCYSYLCRYHSDCLLEVTTV